MSANRCFDCLSLGHAHAVLCERPLSCMLCVFTACMLSACRHKPFLAQTGPQMWMNLRNMSMDEGLCNGTRLIIRHMYRHVLDCEIATGAKQHTGRRVLIPRIMLSSGEGELPFSLKRKQYPVRLAFGMTINKSQRQTLQFVGGYLPTAVFSHGQLCAYVQGWKQEQLNNFNLGSEGCTRR